MLRQMYKKKKKKKYLTYLTQYGGSHTSHTARGGVGYVGYVGWWGLVSTLEDTRACNPNAHNDLRQRRRVNRAYPAPPAA